MPFVFQQLSVRCRIVPKADKMCRDVVSTPKKDFQSDGKSYKITFLTGSGDPAVIDCPDDSYILDAAESQGLDLPATCRGVPSAPSQIPASPSSCHHPAWPVLACIVQLPTLPPSPELCPGGICGACVARVAQGSVDQSDVDDLEFTLEPEQIEAGMALLCMSRATSDVVLETQCDWGLSLGITEWQGASGKLVGEVNPLMGDKWADMTDAERANAEAADKATSSA